MTTYFACVSDSKNYQPRAIFIPMKNISKELLDKITKLTSLGNKIGEVFKFENNIGKIIGYNIEGNFEQVSVEISDIVNFFQGFIHFLEMDDFDDFDDFYDFDDFGNLDNVNNVNNVNNSDNVNDLDNFEKKHKYYPDNYLNVPINYSEILFRFVDRDIKDWKNKLENYCDLDGNKINLFDYVVIEFVRIF